MNTPGSHHQDHNPHLDASDRQLEGALDTLAQSERDGAPPSLESEIYRATVATLRANAPRAVPPVQHDAGRRAPILARIRPARASQSRFRFAIAAGLGAMLCAGALWLALSGQPSSPEGTPSGLPRLADNAPRAATPTTDPDAEVEAMFLASNLFSSGLDAEIDSISASAATLGVSLTDPIGADWSDTLWAGESM